MDAPAPCVRTRAAQVCLAAETCGHVQFNIRGDTWYNSEPFHCGDVPAGEVTYWDIFSKASAALRGHPHGRARGRRRPQPPPLDALRGSPQADQGQLTWQALLLAAAATGACPQAAARPAVSCCWCEVRCGALRLQVALTAMLWGLGTAIGEVPPYFLSYQAAVAGTKNEMLVEVEEHMQAGGGGRLRSPARRPPLQRCSGGQ
jgi:hypothetical protein